jgi:hypothetical protein
MLLYDKGTIYPLASTKTQFVVGSAKDCDVSIDSPVVSRCHCRVMRTKHAELKVMDQSKNGTFFAGRKKKSFTLEPGGQFVIGAEPHRLLVLDEEMRTHYAELTDILGDPSEHPIRTETPSPADMIVTAVQLTRLLITGAPNCEQDRLAQIVHNISPYRARKLTPLTCASLDAQQQRAVLQRDAARSTVVLDLENNAQAIDPTFVSSLFSLRHRLRLVVLARSVDVADNALGKNYARTLAHISLRPLLLREDVVPRLLDRAFAAQRSSLRCVSLTLDNVEALRAYTWPKNFGSLREVAKRLTAISISGTVNAAAPTLNMRRNTLHYWFKRVMKLSSPLTYGGPQVDQL